MNWHLYAFTFLAILGTTISRADQDQVSRYKTFSEGSLRQCSMMNIHQPTFNICLDGTATGPDLERAQAWAARASLTWFRVLKVLDEQVTRTVLFTCKSPHLTIHLRPGNGTSHATPSNTTIFLTRPYGTWTHELGHALAGLGDTYVGGTAGSCGNQPASLMCWGAYGPRANPEEWSTLWPDDIQAIQYNYRRVFSGNPVEPDWASSVNLEAPLHLNEPWPARNEEVLIEDHQVEVLRGPASEIDTDQDTVSVDL